ncbi:hypothetical protein BC937DRAFT_92889 [Endogone sp. FLAS-F59071]|nr:hypothetical protein BC937DRAFT_92889 [Endogone sp. FLAS-F59071]|eukprot:RUS15108.1 hypothetical protein BC937DRAFT_92889 [Endogone sp. FLAS-F59071]
MNNPDRLNRLLNDLKQPLFLPSDVELVWANFPDPNNVIDEHLSVLGVSQLKGHLIWIPPEEFTTVEYLGRHKNRHIRYEGVEEVNVTRTGLECSLTFPIRRCGSHLWAHQASANKNILDVTAAWRLYKESTAIIGI